MISNQSAESVLECIFLRTVTIRIRTFDASLDITERALHIYIYIYIYIYPKKSPLTCELDAFWNTFNKIAESSSIRKLTKGRNYRAIPSIIINQMRGRLHEN